LRQPELAGRPGIIIYTAGSQTRVLDWSPELDGLQPDMPLQPALARYGEAGLLPADTPRYRTVFTGLLDRLEGISPLVEGSEPGCIYLGVDGLQLIYPDDTAVIEAVRGAVPGIFDPRIGLAGNKFLAGLAARDVPPNGYRILTGEAASFLKELSVDRLPVSIRSREKLHTFGLHTMGQVAALPPGPLLSQFGPEGRQIVELARGIDDTPLLPRLAAETIEESLALPSVTVSLEALLVSLEELLGRVFVRLGRSGLGIAGLAVWTRTWNAANWERTLNFKEPAMTVKPVVNRLRRLLEDYPQPGPVEQAGLNVTRLGYPRGRQKSLFTEVRDRDRLGEDIRQLELRLGNPQVYKVQEVEPWSRIPERRYALAPTNR
jgi:DNA polymerase-4/protein ImuB